MRKLPLAMAGVLALSVMPAFAQTPSPSGSPEGDASTSRPVCSASDAARIRNGQQPATPCRVDPSAGSSGSSTMPGAGSGGSNGTPTPPPPQ